MKKSFSIILLSTLIIFNSIEAFVPPVAIGAASLLFARRFTVSVVSADFLINLGKLSKEECNPLSTLQDQTRTVFSWMHDDFFDACQGVNCIVQTIYNAAQKVAKNYPQQKETIEKPTDTDSEATKKN